MVPQMFTPTVGSIIFPFENKLGYTKAGDNSTSQKRYDQLRTIAVGHRDFRNVFYSTVEEWC
jgi:hypothetical protein